jgi:probable HAF family extracellular repeat protein
MSEMIRPQRKCLLVGVMLCGLFAAGLVQPAAAVINGTVDGTANRYVAGVTPAGAAGARQPIRAVTAVDGSCPPAIVELPGIGTGDAAATAYNGTGTVVGEAASIRGGPPRPVVWVDGKPTVIPTGLVAAAAVDINARGQIVGYGEDADGNTRAFHWDGQQLTLLKGLGGAFTYARRINGRGQIAGAADDPNGNLYAVRWSSYRADPEILAPLSPDNSSFSKGINDSGVVGGDSDFVTPDTFIPRAALWDRDGNIRVLDGIGGPATPGEIFEVNNTGQAAGDSANTDDLTDPAFFVHAARWEADGTAGDIGTLPGDNNSVGLGLSAGGYVAGLSILVDYSAGRDVGVPHAFVWLGDGKPLALPVPHGAWADTPSIAHQIDDRGTVAGTYQPPGEAAHAILWTCAFSQAFDPAGSAIGATADDHVQHTATPQGIRRLLGHRAGQDTRFALPTTVSAARE